MSERADPRTVIDVSVIVPTRNRAESVRRTVDSILAQTVTPLEILVVDDASDAPSALAAALSQRPGVRILHAARRGGVSEARNRGLAVARGEWVAFCDDDDLWVPDKLERQLDALRESGARWCLCDAAIIETGWRLVAVRRASVATLDAELRVRNAVPGGGSGVMLESALLDEAGGFDPAFAMFADWELWLRLSRLGRPTSSGAIGVLYRLHAGQMSADPSAAADELARLLRRHADGFDGARRLPQIDRWMLGEMRRAGRYGDAFRFAASLEEGSVSEHLATLMHPAVRAARPWLLPWVDRVRAALGGAAGDVEALSAIARVREGVGRIKG